MGGTAGVSGCPECSRSSLQSNGGLDWSSFLSIAAIHQHHQVHTLLLLQKGTMNMPFLETNEKLQSIVNLDVCVCLLVSDNSLPELSTGNKKLQIHHLQFLLPVSSALWMDVVQHGSPLQCG